MYQRALRNLLMLQDAAPGRDPPDETAMADPPPQPVEAGAIDEEAPRVPDPADPGGPEGPLDPSSHPAPEASEGGEDSDAVEPFPEKEPVDQKERSHDDRGNRHFQPDPTIVPLKLAGSPLSSAAVPEPANAALGGGNLIHRNYQTNPDVACFQQYDMSREPRFECGAGTNPSPKSDTPKCAP